METPAELILILGLCCCIKCLALNTHTLGRNCVCVCLGLNVHKQSRRSSLPSLPFLLCLSFTLSSCSASIFSVTPSLSPSDSVSLCCALFQISSSSLPGRRYNSLNQGCENK